MCDDLPLTPRPASVLGWLTSLLSVLLLIASIPGGQTGFLAAQADFGAYDYSLAATAARPEGEVRARSPAKKASLGFGAATVSAVKLPGAADRFLPARTRLYPEHALRPYVAAASRQRAPPLLA